jgi:hypothetical protein
MFHVKHIGHKKPIQLRAFTRDEASCKGFGLNRRFAESFTPCKPPFFIAIGCQDVTAPAPLGGCQAERKNLSCGRYGGALPENQEVLEMDIQKGLQELHGFDCDNYGLDIVEEDNELSWLDDLFEQYEEVVA